MDIFYCVLIIFLLVGCFIMIFKNYEICTSVEPFGGALLQLVAKGPQDSYLTTDTDKYVPEYYLPYREFIWNNPTRIPYNWYPYYLWPFNRFY